MVMMVAVMAIVAIIISLGQQPDNAGNTRNNDGIFCHRDR